MITAIIIHRILSPTPTPSSSSLTSLGLLKNTSKVDTHIDTNTETSTSTSTSTENDKTALIPYPCDFQFGSKTSTTTFNTSLTNKSDSLLSATGLASTTATTTGSTLQLVVVWSNDVLGTYEFM